MHQTWQTRSVVKKTNCYINLKSSIMLSQFNKKHFFVSTQSFQNWFVNNLFFFFFETANRPTFPALLDFTLCSILLCFEKRVNIIYDKSIDHFRITAIWPGDRIRRPEHPTENEVRRRSCDESISYFSGTNFALITKYSIHIYHFIFDLDTFMKWKYI